MNAGILTFHRANNYGAVLQVYALCLTLKKLGVDPTIIDYIGNKKEGGFFAPCSTYKNIIINAFALMKYRKIQRRVNEFSTFRNNFLPVSQDSFNTLEELQKVAENYSAFICGSDQIWRPSDNDDENRAYYLDFVGNSQAKTIAYAPSFGISAIPDEFTIQLKSFMDNIQHLSVREETGKNIILQATGRVADVVLDPTLLLEIEDWSKIVVPIIIEKPYILVYCLSQKDDFCNLVKHVKEKTKLPVVVITGNAFNRIHNADHVIYDASPQEFVSLFANASCVCTNSFHGTAFSNIFKRPFWTTPHLAANSRIADLLKILGLSNHQIASKAELPESPLDIDYIAAEDALKQAKEDSIAFLRNALSYN